MPFRYVVDADSDLLYIMGCGHATGADYHMCRIAAAKDAAFRHDMDRLLDLQDVSLAEASIDEMQTIISLNRTLGPVGEQLRYRAAVLIRGEIDDILMQTYRAMTRSPSVIVKTFYTLASALQWLDREKDVGKMKDLRRQLLKDCNDTANGES